MRVRAFEKAYPILSSLSASSEVTKRQYCENMKAKTRQNGWFVKYNMLHFLNQYGYSGYRHSWYLKCLPRYKFTWANTFVWSIRYCKPQLSTRNITMGTNTHAIKQYNKLWAAEVSIFYIHVHASYSKSQFWTRHFIAYGYVHIQ